MRVVLCNVPPNAAQALADLIVGEGLAACVNILPAVQSTYVWEGVVQHEMESTLLIKVAADKLDQLRERVVGVHPYDVPEFVVLAVDVASSHRPYVAWVCGSPTG